MASLLYDQVLVEAGQKSILAGPRGAFTMGRPPEPGQQLKWQTAKERHAAESESFSVSMAPETEPGVPSAGPYHEVVRSQTSICWKPTLEPFRRELPGDCDWVEFVFPDTRHSAFKATEERWKRVDKGNPALDLLVPEDFVRSTLIGSVSHDMAVGTCGQCDVSVDRFHGAVLAARFAANAPVQCHGFALPILLPHLERVSWVDVAAIRRSKGMRLLREVLHEVEVEALAALESGADVHEAVRRSHERKLRTAVQGVEGMGSVAGHVAVDVVVAAALGYATTGLALAGPAVAAVAGAAISLPWRVGSSLRQQHAGAWVGVMARIDAAQR